MGSSKHLVPGFKSLRIFCFPRAFLTLGQTLLFLFITKSPCGFILVYVDDILLTGSDPIAFTSLIQVMGAQFALKDLGSISFFLGMEVVHTATGLFLSHYRYISDLLHRFNMQDAKPISTPLTLKSDLHLAFVIALFDGSNYRQLIRSLQYLSLTYPDLSFAISRLVHHLTNLH